jgi:hypothetical protein
MAGEIIEEDGGSSSSTHEFCGSLHLTYIDVLKEDVIPESHTEVNADDLNKHERGENPVAVGPRVLRP